MNLNDQATNVSTQRGEIGTITHSPSPEFTVSGGQATRTDNVFVSASYPSPNFPYDYVVASTIYNDNIAGLAINGGQTADEFDVLETFDVVPANGPLQIPVPVTINAGPSTDLIRAGDTTHSLNSIQGALSVFGKANTTLELDDEGTVNNFFALGDSGFYGHVDNSVTFAVAAGTVTRTNQETETVVDSLGNKFPRNPNHRPCRAARSHRNPRRARREPSRLS